MMSARVNDDPLSPLLVCWKQGETVVYIHPITMDKFMDHFHAQR